MKADEPDLGSYYDRFWSGEDPAALATHDLRAFEQDMMAYAVRLIGSPAGLRVLEIGPGPGHATLWLAENGAEVWAADISRASLGMVRSHLADAGQQGRLLQMRGESLAVADASFDLVFIKCTLMHADWRQVVRESVRVLRPGGRAMFIEPLRHHPAVALYRATLSSCKESRPRYLSWWDLREVGRSFRRSRVRSFYLASPAVLALRGTPLADWLRAPLQSVDRALLSLPFLAPFAWYAVGCYER
jgi:SAM-dependent methyltransferase